MSRTVGGADAIPADKTAPWHRDLLHRMRHVLGIDPRSLALFRVMLGGLLLVDLLLRSRDLSVFYTDQGVLPRAAWAQLAHRWHLSLHGASGELWWQVLLFTLAGIAAIAVMVGYRTRLATLISLLMLGSLMNRNTLVLQGGDQLLVVMCFWALFLPTGMRWSVDAALKPSLRDAPNEGRGANTPWFGVASVAVILQVLYLYFFTALLKTGSAWRKDFDAAFYAVSLQQFATPIGDWMSGFPLLLKGATLFVLAVEFFGPVLVLCAIFYVGRMRFETVFGWTRLTGLALLASLHVAFLLMLHIGLFPLIDLMSLSLLLPGLAWVWLAGASTVPASSPLTLHVREGDENALKRCLLLREFLLPRQTPILSMPDAPEAQPNWYLADEQGHAASGRSALRLIFRRWRPVRRWVQAPSSTGKPDAVTASGRRPSLAARLNASLMARLGWRESPVGPSIAGSVLAGFFLYVVTSYNVWDMPGLRGNMPEHVERPARWMRIDQRWDMFAPYPLTTSLYPLVPGLLRSGEIVDLHRRTSSATDWVVPTRFFPLYDNYRWRKYMGRVHRHSNNEVRRAYGHYHCRAWNNGDRAMNDQLGLLEVSFVSLRTNTEGKPKVESRQRVWRHWCFDEFKSRTIDVNAAMTPKPG